MSSSRDWLLFALSPPSTPREKYRWFAGVFPTSAAAVRKGGDYEWWDVVNLQTGESVVCPRPPTTLQEQLGPLPPRPDTSKLIAAALKLLEADGLS